MQQVTKNVYAETGFQGCNPGFVVTSGGVVMIDTPQLPREAVAWREQVSQFGQVRYLINTEPHSDHITGNSFFSGTVVSHQGTRDVFLDSVGDIAALKERLAQMDPEGIALMEGYQPNPPSIVFSERLTLYVGDHSLELIHLPGHTPSQIAVYIPRERVAFTGDNVVHRTLPYLFQARISRWLESLRTIQALEVDHIVPGHGEVCDPGYVAEFLAFLEEWQEAVRQAIAKGWSKEEAAERISYLERYPMAPGREAFGPELQRTNTFRIYEELIEANR